MKGEGGRTGTAQCPGAPYDHPYSPRPAEHGVHMWSLDAALTPLCVNHPSAKTFFIAAILL